MWKKAKNQRDSDDVALWSKTKKLIKSGRRRKQENTTSNIQWW
jgi:hypothetical protein